MNEARIVCPGHRERDHRLAGICLTCARHWQKSPAQAIEPKAHMDERQLWSCVNFEQVQP